MIKSRIKVMLAMREMTQKELVAKTGIRQPTISALCTGAAKHIPISALDKMCEVLQCQPGELFEFVPDKQSEG